MPPPVTRASTPPSPADQSYVASLSATEPWTHIGLGPEGSVAGARTTLGLKVVVAVALAALFMGASIGIALTFLVIDEDEPKRDVEATVLRPPVAPGPNDAGQAPAEGPGPDDVPTPAHSSSEPDPVATAPPAKQGAGDQVVLPITFPRNGSDPENVDTEQIRQIANLMLQDKRMKVDVVGFAGPDEDVETAERVSARRAKIAVSLLSACGPSRSRFSYQSGGTSAELGRKAVFRVRTE
jgi:outer membrane protein OmpA-like peptidoglycan-associated protein